MTHMSDKFVGLGARVDQMRQGYSNALNDAIKVCREKHKVGDPFAMPCASEAISRAIMRWAPNDVETQRRITVNLLAEAVVRLAEQQGEEEMRDVAE